ncbi:MAG: succinate dehydrogenase, hydrophobic membrane anchor protein [Rhodospirillales bacterium]|nr:succinate dehydrogenase, hydrophobic membrane anchor protein [Rhodospirillales bacterium]
MSMRTPLGRVRGLGANKDGTGHWMAQRFTAIALLPLTLWFVYSIISLTGADQAAFKIWAAEHGNALLLILFVLTMYYHTQLGLQVVIEDYIHHEGLKIASVIAVKLIAILCAASSVIAVLGLAIGRS